MKRVNKIFGVIVILATLNACYPYASPYTNSYGSSSNKSKRQTLCVKYQTQNGWSKGYSVEVNVLKGSTLNQKTNSYSYESYATYGVIFWDNDQASIIKLNYYMGSFTAYGTQGVDQRGRKWQLSKTTMCY